MAAPLSLGSMPALLLVGSLFAVVAAVIHVAIFVLESLLWRRERVWRLFGVRTASDAEVLRPVMLNQGFYNLFLAIGAAAGVAVLALGARDAGFALAMFACVSMTFAAIVLVGTSRRLWRAALFQGVAPLFAMALLAASALMG